ncbi:hypothetical protein QR399_07300 [Campylobacter jejuni]|uniref:Uncharacterized protein n=1 Tax=Campylobacter jejuni TaxID=197 RepID=A0A5T0NKW7_CAMJU|nr:MULTISPECIES: hypothetical protein [Campylobacter]AXL29127.1 hypothetical protein AEI02_06205 [Campylobacter jejuni]EAH7996832.1 hypothetical protein [Campylobacter jejuni]EAH8023704.1 hypothetical protein [Campylobacter jejuni]EAH9122879.1 hypothetical protein [Campylobacter jejuni]EAI2506818.1 hypothetical protein [Campylobacter jejuni]
MGYRCHIATHYEVKYTGGYFNNSENELLELLEKVELLDDTWMNEGREEFEVSTEDVLSLDLKKYDLNEDEKDFLKDLIKVAKTAPYAKNSGYIRLSWF